jgi:hypothetical protein
MNAECAREHLHRENEEDEDKEDPQFARRKAHEHSGPDERADN